MTGPEHAPGTLIGYGRVSTHDQHAESQHDALQAAGCTRIFIDQGVSGKLAKRPQLDAALDYCRWGDTLVITKLDRLGRSVKNLIELVELMRDRDIGLKVLNQGIDTTTPAGWMFFQIMGAIAEFERALMTERTKDGLAAARARGRIGGRRHKLTELQVQQARIMYDSREHTLESIASTFNVSRATIYRYLNPNKHRKVKTS